MGHAGLRKGTDLRSDKLCKLVSFGLESLESGAREESKHKTYKKPGNCGKLRKGRAGRTHSDEKSVKWYNRFCNIILQNHLEPQYRAGFA